MQISTVTLQNFRCFGPDRVTVTLDQLTAFVGANGCGKTALLHALTRLFGVLQSERTLEPDDFHLTGGKTREQLKMGEELTLVIEATLVFPELAGEADKAAFAGCFMQMMVNKKASDPYCRVRLEGTWTKSNLPEGDLQQRLYWVRSIDDDPKDEHKHSMPPHERSRFRQGCMTRSEAF